MVFPTHVTASGKSTFKLFWADIYFDVRGLHIAYKTVCIIKATAELLILIKGFALPSHIPQADLSSSC